MKKEKLYMLALGLLLCAAAGASAADKDAARHERRVEKTVSYLNRDAGALEDKKAVVNKLKSEFHVDDARIKSLSDKKLGYGEIAAVLSVADEMPGGINDDNIRKVTAARQGPPARDWGEVTRTVKVNPEHVADSIKDIEDVAHSQEKMEVEKRDHEEEMEMEGVETENEMNDKEHSPAHEKMETEREERLERMERPERMEPPEKVEVEKPETH